VDSAIHPPWVFASDLYSIMSLQMRRAVGIAGLCLLLIASGAAAAEQRTACDPSQLGREFSGRAIPGIPLLAGIQTGISKGDAKRIWPRMVGGSELVELLPGLFLAGKIEFQGRARPTVSSIRFMGSPVRAPVQELTAHFGSPIEIDSSSTSYEFPGETTPISHRPRITERFKSLKWCDGLRQFVLRVDDDIFTLSIMGPREAR
jgi:hypothetical protein